MYGKTSKLTMYDKFRFLSIKQQKTPILPLMQMSQFCDDSIHFHKWVYGCTGWQSTPLINSILTVPLTVSSEIKFLGLTFDRKLTWRHHIDNVRHRMWLRINAIKALSGRDLGMQSKTLIHLYKMWIRPIALYGAPAYYSAAKTHLNKIQVIQNSALRIALRRNRRSHIEDLHEEGCLIPLKALAARSSHRFMEKKVDDSLIQRLLLEHRIMLDYDRYKRARPSKTPIDLIPEYLETLL